VASKVQQGTQATANPIRLLQVAGVLLLALDVAMTALLYDRLPETIAVHWSATGIANNAGHRELAWLGPMVLAFIIGLGLVSRRHTKAREQVLVVGAVALACLYLFSIDMLALLANVNNEEWQQGSVAGRWMLLALTLPALYSVQGCTRTGRETVDADWSLAADGHAKHTGMTAPRPGDGTVVSNGEPGTAGRPLPARR
jgi:hypothetical protein